MDEFIITVRGEAGPTVLGALGGVDAVVGDGVTFLQGGLADQAALHGILRQLQDLGIEIIEVRRDDSGRPR